MTHLILLLAGYSTRFGSNKLLYQMDGKEMYRHVLDEMMSLVYSEPEQFDLTAVTQYTEIFDYLRRKSIPVVINEDPSRGISSSLQTGIMALAGSGHLRSGDSLIFMTGDQPYLKGKTVRNFSISTRANGYLLGALSVCGEMRSPCLFDVSYLPLLMELRGDRGGKRILKKHAKEVFLFEAESPKEVEDIDML